MRALRKDLRAIAADGAAANFTVGIGENYLPAFALAVTANQLASGLISTVPMLIGGVLQLAAPRMVRALGSHRRWVVLCAAVQTASFLPLVAAAIAGSISVVALFLAVTLYWAAGLAGAPAWNHWVETLIPQRLRATYFGRRTRVAQVALMAGFILGGIALQAGTQHGAALAVFAALFAAAALSRGLSTAVLSSQSEPRSQAARSCALPPLRSLWTDGVSGKVLLYMLAVQVAVQVSGPYFPAYVLCKLGFSYARYMILLGVAYLAKIAVLPALGRLAERRGASALLWAGGVAIVPAAALWTLSDRFEYLLALQVLSGVGWAAFELGQLLMFFDAVPAARRVGVLTLYNLLNAVTFLAGSLVGGWLLAHFATSAQAYHLIFVVSSVLRLGALGILVPWRAAATALGRTAREATAPSAVVARPHLRIVRADGVSSPPPQVSRPAPPPARRAA